MVVVVLLLAVLLYVLSVRYNKRISPQNEYSLWVFGQDDTLKSVEEYICDLGYHEEHGRFDDDSAKGTYYFNSFYGSFVIHCRTSVEQALIKDKNIELYKLETPLSKEQLKYREEQHDRLLSLGASNIRR